MNIKALRESSPKELQEELTSLLRELFNLRMQRGAGESPKPHQFSAARRNIARIKTVIREKEGNTSHGS